MRTVLLIVVLVGIYLTALWWDIKKVTDFCSEITPGLDVKEIAILAAKYDVGFKSLREGDLGLKIPGKKDTWFVSAAAPMTIGEHACGIYHNNKEVLSASKWP